jgi:arabinogalactan endo-1,4-beta-galactosidase
MDLISGSNEHQRVVEFENKKSRGDVVQKVSYTYTKHDNSNYLNIFNSVKEVSDDEAEAQKRANRANQLVDENTEAINAVIEAINSGYKARTDIQKYCCEELGLSNRKTNAVFASHCGDLWNSGHRINYVKTGEGNKRIYNVIKHH